jgi:hypothetical protein
MFSISNFSILTFFSIAVYGLVIFFSSIDFESFPTGNLKFLGLEEDFFILDLVSPSISLLLFIMLLSVYFELGLNLLYASSVSSSESDFSRNF